MGTKAGDVEPEWAYSTAILMRCDTTSPASCIHSAWPLDYQNGTHDDSEWV